MAIQAAKIRLGACDMMKLFATTDLGASVGGCEINYNPTVFQVEIDQAVLPVKAFHTKEEVTFKVAVVQAQMNILLATFGYAATGVVTTASGSLGTMGPPTLAVVGTAGAVTYTYALIAYTSAGDGIPSTTGTTSTGPTTLSALNYIHLTWTAIAGAVGYKIQRTAGGSGAGIIGDVPAGTTSFDDTGLAATAYTPSAAQPTMPNVDTANFGGTVNIPSGVFDFAIPKNDGTTNHLRGHFHNCYSGRPIKLDAKRDKHSEFGGFELVALADLTKAVGQQAGWIAEEY